MVLPISAFSIEGGTGISGDMWAHDPTPSMTHALNTLPTTVLFMVICSLSKLGKPDDIFRLMNLPS
ncbi:MAG TPA: hypothetical protein VES96_04745 [Nitrospiraceae bacterium]|nr:hypothetical protein [Nitrospiraceae bacterium]